MRYSKSYIQIPNTLIDDTVMHYTSKVVYTVLAYSQRKSGLIKLTVAELVERTGLCEATVLQALCELEAGGFICKKRNWRFSAVHGNRLVFASNTYKLHLDLSNGYTLISASLLTLELTPACFCVLLFLYRCAGRNGRAFPSIRYIAGTWRDKTGKGLCMAKSTVLRALKHLAKLQLIEKRTCEAENGGLCDNSYYMTNMVLHHVSAVVCSIVHTNTPTAEIHHGGGFIFGEASLINKITKRISIGKEKRCFYLVQFAEKLRKIAKLLKTALFTCLLPTDTG